MSQMDEMVQRFMEQPDAKVWMEQMEQSIASAVAAGMEHPDYKAMMARVKRRAIKNTWRMEQEERHRLCRGKTRT